MTEEEGLDYACSRLSVLIGDLRAELDWPHAPVRVGAIMSDVLLTLGCSPETAMEMLDYDVFADMDAIVRDLAWHESGEGS
jgi:hypothetical protein